MPTFFFFFYTRLDYWQVYREVFHLFFVMLCTGGWPETGSAEGRATASKKRRLFERGDQWAAAGNFRFWLEGIRPSRFPLKRDRNKCDRHRCRVFQHVFLVCVHRGFKRQRAGTRNSARVLPQQHDPYWDRLRIYRPHWVDRQHPGKNWRRASLIGWVRDKTVAKIQHCATWAHKLYCCSAFDPVFFSSADAQAQLAVAVEKERSATEELLSVKSQLASLESQNSLVRQEKARLLAQLEAEKNKREKVEDESSR